LRFKRSTEQTGRRPALDGLWQDIKDRIVSKFSMGVEILEASDQRNTAGALVLRLATKWRPFEISLAPIPADFGTTTLASQVGGSTADWHVASAQRDREIEILRLR
jgi:hypothetical protein